MFEVDDEVSFIFLDEYISGHAYGVDPNRVFIREKGKTGTANEYRTPKENVKLVWPAQWKVGDVLEYDGERFTVTNVHDVGSCGLEGERGPGGAMPPDQWAPKCREKARFIYRDGVPCLHAEEQPRIAKGPKKDCSFCGGSGKVLMLFNHVSCECLD